MAYKIRLFYFKPTGQFLANVEIEIDRATVEEVWEEVHELRRMGRLPALRANAGRDLFVLVDIFDQPLLAPKLRLHLVLPPTLGEEDVTAVRVPTGEMTPLVGLPLEAMPRTSTRDVVKERSSDADVTPVDPIPVVVPGDDD